MIAIHLLFLGALFTATTQSMRAPRTFSYDGPVLIERDLEIGRVTMRGQYDICFQFHLHRRVATEQCILHIKPRNSNEGNPYFHTVVTTGGLALRFADEVDSENAYSLESVPDLPLHTWHKFKIEVRRDQFNSDQANTFYIVRMYLNDRKVWEKRKVQLKTLRNRRIMACSSRANPTEGHLRRIEIKPFP